LAQVNKKNKHLSHLIKIVVAVTALYFAFKGESVKDIAKVFAGLNIFVFIAALGLFFISQLVFVLRWLTLLRAQGIHIAYFAALKLHLLGLFYNNCLPGSVGGDALRAWYVTMHTEKKIEAALSVFVDRAIGLSCTVAIIFLSYWLIPTKGAGAQLQFGTDFDLASLVIKALAVLAGLVLLAAMALALMYFNRKFRPILFKYVLVFAIRWKLWLGRIATAVKLYCCKPFTLFLAIILTFICQSMAILGFWFIGRNLGIEAHIKYYFVFFPISWIIGVIPISVGGAGVMELGLKGLFGQVAQVTARQGLILALAQRLIWLITSLPGVVIHLAGKHLPDSEEIKPEIDV